MAAEDMIIDNLKSMDNTDLFKSAKGGLDPNRYQFHGYMAQIKLSRKAKYLTNFNAITSPIDPTDGYIYFNPSEIDITNTLDFDNDDEYLYYRLVFIDCNKWSENKPDNIDVYNNKKCDDDKCENLDNIDVYNNKKCDDDKC